MTPMNEQNTSPYSLSISSLSSLETLLDSHFDATACRGVMPRICLDSSDNSVLFISEMKDHSELLFKIEELGRSSWLATIEVRNKENTPFILKSVL